MMLVDKSGFNPWGGGGGGGDSTTGIKKVGILVKNFEVDP